MSGSFEMHPVERTLYSPVLSYLIDLGFVGVQEIKRGPNYVDILFEYGKNRYILELKVERRGVSDPIITGIVQAYRYGLTFDTNNLIVISYPSSVSENIHNIYEVEERALRTRVEGIILTENWYSYEKNLNTEEIFSNLKAKIDRKIIAAMKVESASIVLQKGVKVLSRLLNKYYKDEFSIQEIANHLTKDYGLFVKLSSSKISKSRMRNQTIDLLAYILANQILFYFLYAKKSGEMVDARKVPEIGTIRHMNDLNIYFDRIREIDYKPIFDIFVVPRVPSNKEIVAEVNNLIECLTPLKISEMRHDIYGRLIGSSLPKETREILAAYYTRTTSADLLTNLTIDSYDDKVCDLACGSGTLLVSSYDRKLKIYQNEKRIIDRVDEDKLHRKFVEQDLTGIDIMPFACHLTGLNLSAKNLRSVTDFLRISTMNSLRIQSLENPITIEEAYGDISKELERIKISQQTIDVYTGTKKIREIQPRTFQLDKVDRVVINPPFTSINKLPNSYRESITSSSLSKICGRRIHLWGYFLALTNIVLKDGGKVGAIIPISLLHGKDTHKLRRYYLENYSIEYIIKPTRGKYFSEDSNFKDIIFIAKKIKPDRNHKVRIVCLNVDLENLSSVDIETLSKNLRTELENKVVSKEYLLDLVPQKELLLNSENLMPYVFTNNGKLKTLADNIMKQLKTNPNLIKVDKKKIRDGHQLRPKGEVARSVISRHYSDARVKRAPLSFKDDTASSDVLEYVSKHTNQIETIKKSDLVKTFRTITGIDTFDATGLHDYLLKSKSIIKETVNLIIPNRYQLYSSETFLTATYIEDPLCPMNTFMMYQCNKDKAKILTLYFNSIFYLLQLVMFAKQSTRAYLEFKQLDLFQVLVPDIDKMNEQNRIKLLTFYDKYKKIKLKSIPTQLEEKTEYRLALDKAIADNVGINISRNTLVQTYDLILDQIKSLP